MINTITEQLADLNNTFKQMKRVEVSRSKAQLLEVLDRAKKLEVADLDTFIREEIINDNKKTEEE